MAIRKFNCGHSRTVQPYQQTIVHQINGICPACQRNNQKLVCVNDIPKEPTKKVLNLKKQA